MSRYVGKKMHRCRSVRGAPYTGWVDWSLQALGFGSISNSGAAHASPNTHRCISHHHKDDSDTVDTVILGGGCVGLAIARHLLLNKPPHCHKDVLLVDKNPSFGQETSSRNSEVVHAGLYYPPDSLKARLCVAGKHMLYRYCESNNIWYNKCGKIVVASSREDVDTLEIMYSTALKNGVDDVKMVTPEQVAQDFQEPGVSCVAALHSPSSGVVDSHGYMACLENDIISYGGMVAYNTLVVGGSMVQHAMHPQFVLSMIDTVTGEETTVSASRVINSCGLWATKVSLSILPSEYHSRIPKTTFVKGNYVIPKQKMCFSQNQLVYPVPSHDGGLGVHLTIDRNRSIRFGPDVEWLPDKITDPDDLEYAVDPQRVHAFEEALGRYTKHPITPGSLEPSYSGVRPKVVNAGDFVIDTHGIPGFVGLYGIESPGLTASLAIAQETAQRV